MGKYTKETLEAINARYCDMHSINDSDLEMANRYVELIERTRSTTVPKAGDVLQLTNEYGEYYEHAHIEYTTEDRYGGNVCEKPYVPFISPLKDVSGIACSTSGGAWANVDPAEMKYVGKTQKRFHDWGHYGGCADGAVEFEAEVSVWEWKHPKCGEYTTKDYDKFYWDYSYKKDSEYKYIITTAGCLSHTAFKTKSEFDLWLHTFRGVIVDNTVWCWKHGYKSVSPVEFEALEYPEDTMLYNGSVYRCKRAYDEEKHLITTYHVWYWEEEGDFYEVAQKQNEIRDRDYKLPWNTPIYSLARKAVNS